jgi:hypothetical protein
LHGQHLRATPRQDLELRHESGDDVVADQVGEALLQIEGIAHAAHVSALVLDADKQRSARGIGEGDDRLERAVRGGEVALELEGLALRALEQLDEVHALGSVLGSAGKHQSSEHNPGPPETRERMPALLGL